MTDLARPTPPPPRWPLGSTGSVLFIFGLVFAHLMVMFGLGFAVMIAIGLDPRTIVDAPPLAFVALAIAGTLDVGIVFVLLLGKLGRYRLADLGWSRFTGRDVAFGVVGFVALVGVALLSVIMKSGTVEGVLDWLVEAVTDVTTPQRALCLLIGCLAAFTEETLFRGMMQPALQHKLGRHVGLIVTALVFAAYHFRFAPPIFLGKLGVGLVLGVMRDRTGSLWAPAIAHALQWTVLCFA
jgi:membrane protease YdiL (CAAX protease family)